jgi:hypothetical protein
MRSFRRTLRTLAIPFQALGRSLGGIFPSLTPAGSPAGMSPGLLAGTAVAVPLVIVAIVAVVYLRRGRTEQFQQFMSQAQTAVVAAQLKPTLEEARPEWQAAGQWLAQARRYGGGEEAEALQALVDQALDRLDNIERIEFAPAVGGGFGPRARLRAAAATSNDLYVYDESPSRDLPCLVHRARLRDRSGFPVSAVAAREFHSGSHRRCDDPTRARRARRARSRGDRRRR